jgi:hypothetical protein
MEIGEHWAYRRLRDDLLAEVQILAFGTKKPDRVKIVFVDDEFEGRSEWVPSGRLRVIWAESARLLAEEALWADLRAEASVRPEVEHEAAMHILALCLPSEVATQPWRPHTAYRFHGGLTEVFDWDSLEKLAGVTKSDLCKPVALHLARSTVIGWPATRKIAMMLAKKYPERIREDILTNESELRCEVAHGIRRQGDRWVKGSSQDASELLDEFYGKYFALLEEWAGIEHPSKFSEADEQNRPRT